MTKTTWHVDFSYDAREFAELLNEIEQHPDMDLQDLHVHACGNGLTKYIVIATTTVDEKESTHDQD